MPTAALRSRRWPPASSRSTCFRAEGSKLRPKLPSDLTIEPGKTTDSHDRAEGPPRERTVAGRVIDREAEPVAGATVFQSGDSPARTEAKTGADGRFALNGVVARPTFLFARKPGYRFGGLAIAPESADVTLVIHKVDEPPRHHAENASAPIAPPGGNRAVRTGCSTHTPSAFSKKGASRRRCRTLEALARIEPERVLELIHKEGFQCPVSRTA